MVKTITKEDMLAIPAIELSDESKLPREPLVSVFIPTYNHRPYVRQAIESVLEQECLFTFEVLIGDDCSTDGTLEICKEYQQRHPDRVRVVTGPSNIGPKRNSYRLICRARGKYVAYCEGDDFWTVRDALAKRVKMLERHPEASMCFAEAEVMLQECEDKPPVHLYYRRPPIPKPMFDVTDAVEIVGRYSHTTAFLLRRELLQYPQWHPRSLHGDLCMVTLLLLQGPAVHLKEVTSVYRKTKKGVWTSMGVLDQNLTLIHTYSLLCAHAPRPLRFIRTQYLLPLAVTTVARYGRLRFLSTFWRRSEPTKWLVWVMFSNPLHVLRLVFARLKNGRWQSLQVSRANRTRNASSPNGGA